jgi:large subunit ribosomal protein L19e
MNLRKKKILASKTLGVGKERIVFVTPRLDEIKEEITKEGIRQLHKDGAIKIKEVGGRRKKEKSKKKRGPGKIRNKVNKGKKEYMALTRKLRKYSRELTNQGTISKEELKEIRKKIRNRQYRSKAHFKEQIKAK